MLIENMIMENTQRVHAVKLPMKMKIITLLCTFQNRRLDLLASLQTLSRIVSVPDIANLLFSLEPCRVYCRLSSV